MFSKRSLRSALLLVAAGLGGGQVRAEAAVDPKWDSIAFEVKSWGAPINTWTIRSDGGGSWSELLRPDSDPTLTVPTIAWHEIAPDAAQYIALEEVMRRLPEPAPDSNACEQFMTDAPYGTLRLTKGATTTEIAWNDGCRDQPYRDFVAILQEANGLVGGWGKAASVSYTMPAEGQ